MVAAQPRLEIPDSHRVVRYCKPSTIDPSSGSILSTAFERKVDESTVSVNDLDMAPGTSDQQRLLATKQMLLLRPSPNGKFAVAGVSAIREIDALPSLDVIYDPVTQSGRENNAHCGITNVPAADGTPGQSVLLALLDTVLAEHWVRDIT